MILAQKLGLYAIELINEQIEEGKDIDGKDYAYSEKPFFMPYKQDVVKKFGGMKSGKGIYFNVIKKDKKKGLIILKGYKSFRAAYSRSTDSDFLQFKGTMLASMKVVNSSDTEFEIGFSDRKSAENAYYLNVTGAGRGRKLWKFFGLNAENQEKLANLDGKITPSDVEIFLKKLINNANNRI